MNRQEHFDSSLTGVDFGWDPTSGPQDLPMRPAFATPHPSSSEAAMMDSGGYSLSNMDISGISHASMPASASPMSVSAAQLTAQDFQLLSQTPIPTEQLQGQISAQQLQRQMPAQQLQGQMPAQQLQGQISAQQLQGQIPAQQLQAPVSNLASADFPLQLDYDMLLPKSEPQPLVDPHLHTPMSIAQALGPQSAPYQRPQVPIAQQSIPEHISPHDLLSDPLTFQQFPPLPSQPATQPQLLANSLAPPTLASSVLRAPSPSLLHPSASDGPKIRHVPRKTKRKTRSRARSNPEGQTPPKIMSAVAALGGHDTVLVEGGPLSITPVPHGKDKVVVPEKDGIPQVAVGRNAEFRVDLSLLKVTNPPIAARVTSVFRNIHRTYLLSTNEYPTASCGRGSARRVGVPVFSTEEAMTTFVLEVDLSLNGKCLSCITDPSCVCLDPLLIAHRADMKRTCMSGISWDEDQQAVSFRHHINDKFRTSTLPSSTVRASVKLYDTTNVTPTVMWSTDCVLVSRNSNYCN